MTVARSAWGIAHSLPHRRAVSVPEDACQGRRGHAPQVRAARNNGVVGIVQQAGHGTLPAAQRACTDAVDRLMAYRSIARSLSSDFAHALRNPANERA